MVRALAQGLSARGHAVSVVAPSASGPADLEEEGAVPVRRIATVPVPVGYQLRVAPFPLRSVGAWFDRQQPDVVHIHHPFPLSLAAGLAARRRGIPLVATNHTVPECSLWGMRGTGRLYAATSAGMSGWIRWLMQRCDRVATPTETAAGALRAMGFKREVTVISNGVDVERFRPGSASEALRQRLGLDGRPVVLYTGRLNAEKDMETWVRAAAAVPDAQLVIGGQGTDRARLEGLVHQLGAAGRTRFTGYLSDADYPRLYRLAAVYFITSPVELQSITTLEAVASGLPVVGVRAGALPELICEGVNGSLIQPGDAVAGTRELAWMMHNEANRAQMGTRSREIGLRHSQDRTVEQYERFLFAAAGSKERGQPLERASARGN